MTTQPTLLIVDDEVRSLETLQRILEDDFDVKTASSTAEAERILAEEWVQLILCDQRMPDVTGVEFLKQVRDKWPDVVRMIISGYTDSEDIISAVNEAGIYQYITKPWHPDNLILTLKNASQLFELQRQNETFRPWLHDGTHGLPRHPGAFRLQHAPLERLWFLPAWWVCRQQLHGARVRGAGTSFCRDAEDCRHPDWPAHGYAQGLVHCAGLAVQGSDAATPAQECHCRSHASRTQQ